MPRSSRRRPSPPTACTRSPTGCADNAAAVTRFVLVGRPGAVPAPTGADKTSLMVHLPSDRAGALLEMLEQFATRGVNLSRIESRPIGDALGRYSFSIDAEGHIADARMAEALMGLHRVCPVVRFLGSYPKAERVGAEVAPGMSDADFAGRPRTMGSTVAARATAASEHVYCGGYCWVGGYGGPWLADSPASGAAWRRPAAAAGSPAVAGHCRD